MRKYIFLFLIAISSLGYFVSLNLNSKEDKKNVEQSGAPMIAKYEPSGTHISKDGYLKVRIDLFPTADSKTYSTHHIQVPVTPPEGYPGKIDESKSPVDMNDYDKWLEGLPKKWQVNPALSHFIKVDQDVSKEILSSYLTQIFDKNTIRQLDDLLSQSKTDLKAVSVLMQSKRGKGNKVSGNIDLESIKKQLNIRLSGFEIKVGQL